LRSFMRASSPKTNCFAVIGKTPYQIFSEFWN